MAHDQQDSKQKIVYVGDSRVRKNTTVYTPKDYSAYPGKSEAFVPNFLLKEWMVGAVVLVGIMTLVMAHPSPLGYPANPTNTAFIPMPDWYFLFLYQLLKYPYTSDQFLVLGTVGIPGLAFGALTLAPFLDTGKERRFYRRPVASALMLLSLAAMVYLTHVSWDHYQHELKAKNIIPEHIKREQDLKAGKEVPKAGGNKNKPIVAIVDDKDPAFELYTKSTCVQCHGKDLKGNANAGVPSLRGIGDKYDSAGIMDIIHNGLGQMAAQYDYNINEVGLSDGDLQAIADWLAKQKAE